MGFNIKNNYGPNIEVNEGGNVTLYQDANGMWHTVEDVDAEVVESKNEVFLPCELHFFDQVEFGSEEKQPKLIALLNEVAQKLDINNGRDWFCIYAAYRYYKGQLAVSGGYKDFFVDIEALMPDKLTKIDRSQKGDKRYVSYTTLMGREAALWYMDKGKLPPLNEITIWKSHFDGDKNRFAEHAKIIIDVIKRLRSL